jgi:hypothetical protein
MAAAVVQHAQPSATRPPGMPFLMEVGPAGPYWSGAIGAGAGIAVDLALHINVLARAVAQLPAAPVSCRPAVGAYLAMVRHVAAEWDGRLRTELLSALESLAHAGTCLGHGKPARATDALLLRLSTPLAALATLAAGIDDLLTLMVDATGSLQQDTQQLTERLQSDHVHAFLLSQQASTLQSKLDDAILRQDAYWLQGPHAEQTRQEIALHKSALEGVQRQLYQQQAEQAATRAEAYYLQTLMPSLSACLGALDHLAGAVRAILGGASALLAELRELKRALVDPDDGGAGAERALRAAQPRWRALAADAARLRQPAPARTRAGCPP